MHAIKSKRMVLGAVALVIGLTGCASAGGGGTSGPRSSPTRLVLEDLQDEAVMQLDAYQAIQRLRPRWLQTRGTTNPMLYVDGVQRGTNLGELRSIRVADVQQMQYLSANDASTRFGTGHGGGAILLTTRR